MKLICYPTVRPSSANMDHDLTPAPSNRAWMDATPLAFANRCLPLTVANSYGWQISATVGFRARWDGKTTKEAIVIEADCSEHSAADLPISHFGSGILTFHVNALFKSEPGVNLFVGGPINQIKDGIAPLTGIVETDWSPFTFTMNWQFTRPDHWLRFDEGEAICQIFPIEPALLENTEPSIRTLDSDPDLYDEYKVWSQSRQHFIAELKTRPNRPKSEGWQKNYHRGSKSDGRKSEVVHRTKISAKKFIAD